MKLSDFDYILPKKLIAQEPIRPRDHSRLLVLKRQRAPKALASALGAPIQIEHKHFYDIVDYLKKGDVLVLNNSKVFPARLIGKRQRTGGKVEVFLLRRVADGRTSPVSSRARKHPLAKGDFKEVWQCLVGGPRRKIGLTVEFGAGLKGEILADNQDGTWNVKFNKTGRAMMKIVEKIGLTPLPPYIKRTSRIAYRASHDSEDSKLYQTVYADERKTGSVAAPTAGFHFTPALLRKIKKKGVHVEYVTLHVGLGTFAPVKVNDITKHKMHAEYVEIREEVIKNLIKAKNEKRRIIAVGTTSVRALESVFSTVFLTPHAAGEESRGQHGLARDPSLRSAPLRMTGWTGWVNIFIYPGYEFRIVDAMITNFHLPKSTLLMLISAFAGKRNIDKAYETAIKKKYRYYSYGDAMFIY